MKMLRSIVNEGITHIEDLSAREFVNTVRTIRDRTITEKLDGAQLWFGLDEHGVFTSREGKSASSARVRAADTYALTANYNAFRAAHAAVIKAAPIIEKNLQIGDIIEIEVIFGRQPNTVTYASDQNYIVLLRPIGETSQDTFKKLASALNRHSVRVQSDVISSADGRQLQTTDTNSNWTFTSVRPIKSKKIDLSAADKILSQMEKWLIEKNSDMPDLSNEQVVDLNLASVSKDARDSARAARERARGVLLNDFKLPIKDSLLDKIVRRMRSSLSSGELHPDEDIGIEGVVVRDPATGSMTKIVDRDVFTAINTFNSAVRASIAGLTRTLDQQADLGMRGGALGQARIRIAELMGNRELALSSGLKRILKKFKQQDPASTARALADSLGIHSPSGARAKIIAILQSASKEIDEIIEHFKQQQHEYRLVLKTGKEIGIAPEIAARTLTAAASAQADIVEIISAVSASRTATDLVLALYGRAITDIFTGESTMFENIRAAALAEQEGGGEGAGAAAAGGEGGTAVTSAGAVGGALMSTVPSVGITGASSIAALPKPIFQGTKIISRRKRTFVKPKKFPSPSGAGIKNENKFSLIKSINEDYTDIKSMKFATDVDDSAKAHRDAMFKKLRNNVAIGDNISQSTVSKYLDKAHEINNEVDTITFGMEMDNGDIVKVYVAANQADNFEKALAKLLGEKDDVEEVINLLSNTFDIVDVEWPRSMRAAEDRDDAQSLTPEPSNTSDEQIDQEPEIDLGTTTAEQIRANVSYKNLKAMMQNAENAGASAESTEQTANEDVATTLKALSDMLIIMGIDPEQSRSIESQANQAKVRASLGKLDPTVVSKMQGLAALINKKIHPGQLRPAAAASIPSAPPAAVPEARQRARLLTAFIAEQAQDMGAWTVANLAENGVLLKVRGMTVHVDDDSVNELAQALAARETITIHAVGADYKFAPLEGGDYSVKNVDDSTHFPAGIVLQKEHIATIISMERAR